MVGVGRCRLCGEIKGDSTEETGDRRAELVCLGEGVLFVTVLRCRREIWDVGNSSWPCKGAR
jgi:hypothetical protein